MVWFEPMLRVAARFGVWSSYMAAWAAAKPIDEFFADA